jgi:hypothetical protein
MNYNKQTQENFNEMAEKVKAEYQGLLTKYGWKFNHSLETFMDVQVFTITSGDMSTILKFDPTSKYIFRTDLTSANIKIINKLQEGLK